MQSCPYNLWRCPQCRQEMAGYLYLRNSFMSQTSHELLPSSQKTNLKGKGSFPSMFGLCTKLEICPLSSWVPMAMMSKKQDDSVHSAETNYQYKSIISQQIDPSSLHWAESSNHPLVIRYPSSKPNHHQFLIGISDQVLKTTLHIHKFCPILLFLRKKKTCISPNVIWNNTKYMFPCS